MWWNRDTQWKCHFTKENNADLSIEWERENCVYRVDEQEEMALRSII